MGETRKIAAILVLDMVGFSRLAGADEEGILARLRVLRSDLMGPAVSAHHGRLVKNTGDGSIVEFRSVVDAVRCATTVQSAMVERNAGVSPENQINFRIGIHLGDVVEESDGDLMGDGVNIASRIQGAAGSGGICLSEDAYRQVKANLKLAASDLGPTVFKNITEPIRVYAIGPVSGTHAKSPQPTATPRLDLPDKPSIAVLPFQNMSHDHDQDYFADGIVDDILTGLSRIRWLFVIARNSSFVYKGRAVDVRQVGRELGVRYVLEGSVRKSDTRLRVTAQLVEAETGAHLWADKFDGDVKDVFEFQDQITERVVGIVEPRVRKSEIERSRRKRPESLDAYDLYLRASSYLAAVSLAEVPIAAGFLREALELDPDYAAAHAYIAWAHQISFTHDGRFNEAEKIAGLQHARAAIAHDVEDPTALAVGAMVTAFLGNDADAALNAIERAVSSNPSSAVAHYFGAALYAWSGDPVRAATYAHRALRLSPFDPLAYLAYLGLAIAALQEGRYQESAANFGKCADSNPGFGSFAIAQAAMLALAGRMEEAATPYAQGLKCDPHFRIRTILELGYPPAIEERYVRGLRLLGAPE